MLVSAAKFTVIPSEAARRAAQSRDLFLSTQQQKRSLHFASLRSAPVAMTGVNSLRLLQE